MPEVGRLKLIMHAMISLIIMSATAWIYSYHSSVVVICLIISWVYWNELKNSERWKILQNSQRLIDENLDKPK